MIIWIVTLERTRRAEVSYEEIASVAALPRNDILIYDV